MKKFSLRFLASDKIFYEGPCESLMVPLTDGLYGVMADHTDMMGAILPGEAILRIPDGDPAAEKFGGESLVQVVVGRGLIKVEEGKVLVLVDTAELPSEIDENRARRAAEKAAEELLQKQGVREFMIAQNELSRAMARLKYKNHSIK